VCERLVAVDSGSARTIEAMTVTPNDVRPSPTALLPLSLAVAIAILGITVIWTIAVPIGPEACALSMPGPRNCYMHDRAQDALLATIAITLVGAVVASIAIVFTQSRRVMSFLGPIVLMIASVAGYLSAAWIPAWAFPWLN
jgi:hypothetical protein